jgi:hypothetical protein
VLRRRDLRRTTAVKEAASSTTILDYPPYRWARQDACGNLADPGHPSMPSFAGGG